MLNSVNLIGRLTKDVELKQTSNGKAFARFTLAVNRLNGDADFIPIKVWNKTAENCAEYIGKGSLVAINGRIETGSYEKDGQTVYTTDVVAFNVHFLDLKPKPEKREMTINPFTGDKLVRDDPFAGSGEQDEVKEFPWE